MSNVKVTRPKKPARFFEGDWVFNFKRWNLKLALPKQIKKVVIHTDPGGWSRSLPLEQYWAYEFTDGSVGGDFEEFTRVPPPVKRIVQKVIFEEVLDFGDFHKYNPEN